MQNARARERALSNMHFFIKINLYLRKINLVLSFNIILTSQGRRKYSLCLSSIKSKVKEFLCVMKGYEELKILLHLFFMLAVLRNE